MYICIRAQLTACGGLLTRNRRLFFFFGVRGYRRVSAMTLGGISKASKGINLSEDIFGGFNFVLRGGKATQAEYVQVCFYACVM